MRRAKRLMEAGADGLFLSAPGGDYDQLAEIALALKANYPARFVGLALFDLPLEYAVSAVQLYRLDGLWVDYSGIDSEGATLSAQWVSARLRNPDSPLVFATVGEPGAIEPYPWLAAEHTVRAGFVPVADALQNAYLGLEMLTRMKECGRGLLALRTPTLQRLPASLLSCVSHLILEDKGSGSQKKPLPTQPRSPGFSCPEPLIR